MEPFADLQEDIERNRTIAACAIAAGMPLASKHNIKMAAYSDTLDILFMRQVFPNYGSDELSQIAQMIPLDS